MSEQGVGVGCQAVLRKQRADRERRLGSLAVTVLTALGERDALVRDTERRAGQALQTMTEDEGLSVARRSSGAAVALLRCGRSPGCANLRTTRWAATVISAHASIGSAIRSAIRGVREAARDRRDDRSSHRLVLRAQ